MQVIFIIIKMVIIMRVFYLYNVNDFFCSVYERYPYNLYKMLEEAYFTNKHQMMVASSYYEELITNFNKLYLNNYLFANNKLDAYYYRKNNIHVISSRLEYSKLMVNGYCLKLKTNLNYPKFFEHIRDYSDNIFVCDFDNQDYFWLSKVVKSEKKDRERIDKQREVVVKYP